MALTARWRVITGSGSASVCTWLRTTGWVAKATGKVLIVHEDTLTGGLGGEIAAIIAEHAFEYLDAPIRRVAAPDIPAMPFHHAMEDFFMPNREKIAAAARELAAY